MSEESKELTALAKILAKEPVQLAKILAKEPVQLVTPSVSRETLQAMQREEYGKLRAEAVPNFFSKAFLKATEEVQVRPLSYFAWQWLQEHGKRVYSAEGITYPSADIVFAISIAAGEVSADQLAALGWSKELNKFV